MRALLDAPRPPGFGHAARAAARAADTEALYARLGPVKRALLRALLAGAQHWVSERERTKSLAISLVHRLRRTVQAAAVHLLRAGALRRADDVFFLTLPELAAALQGRIHCPAPC